jgi:Tol biopolymer transport system component/predicted Ser/Thr protein kinase
MIGSALGHFKILEKIGEGGMGVVFKARDTHLDRFVAVKVLTQGAAANPERRLRFIQEAKTASALNHPNIVTVYDIDQHLGAYFIAMEYIEGATLDRVMGRQPLALTRALGYASQIADGLAAAHAAGVVHRDIKPSNLMVTPRGLVKVLDFGLAKLNDPTPAAGEEEATKTQRPLTEEGTICGTVSYMSPEQAQGKPVDSRSDIFSFGAVLYEMLAGQRAFQQETKMATLAAIINQEPKPLSEIVPGLPPELERVLNRSLRKDAAKRWQTMGDLKVALDELKQETDSGKTAAPGPAAASPKRRWVVWGVAGGCALGLVLAFAVLRPMAKPPVSPAAAMRVVPLTSFPGSESSPSFSPDGNQVAFVWNGEKRDNPDIYVKLVEGGEALRLTRDTATEHCPQWAPDGRQIAFVRSGAAYLISPLGGAERRIVDTDVRCLAWSPDSKRMAYAYQGALFLYSLETGEKRALASGVIPDATFSMSFSPDGKSLAFTRHVSINGASSIYLVETAGGQPRRLPSTAQFVYGLTWTRDSSEIVFSMDRGNGGELWRMAVNGGGPVRFGTDTGVYYPVIAHRGDRLAYSRGVQDVNIWKMEPGITPAPSLLIGSTRRDFSPQLSPDGQRIAFTSERGGSWEIYRGDTRGGTIVQLSSFGNAIADGARWSADGRQIAFAAMIAGNRDIYVVGADGGSVRRLTSEASEDGRPSWSADGNWIYFRSDRSGKQQIWKMPSGGGAATQVTPDGGFEALESVDGKTLYFVRARTERGLWSQPASGGTPIRVSGLDTVTGGFWAVASDAIYFLEFDRSAETYLIQAYRLDTGKISKAGRIEKPVWAAPPAFSVSRDGKRLVWHQTDHQDADLVLVENFR